LNIELILKGYLFTSFDDDMAKNYRASMAFRIANWVDENDELSFVKVVKRRRRLKTIPESKSDETITIE
jgi:hypothetical protein